MKLSTKELSSGAGGGITRDEEDFIITPDEKGMNPDEGMGV